MKGLDRSEAILVGLLSIVGREIVRTKLVKMTYLLDNLSFEQKGCIMTDFTYHWGHYGPNAVGNTITQRLSNLSVKGLIHNTQKLTPYENYANYYKIDVNVDPDELPLTNDDWVLIYAIVNQYGPLSRQQVVKASKETFPMKDAGQYDILKFQRNPKIEATRHSFYENKRLVHETKVAVQDVSSDPISLEELRGEVGKST